jgi:conjugative transposon TraK protein
MFTKMKNIDSAFRYVRLFTIVINVGCFCVCLLVVYKSYSLSAATESRIYVLANGKVLEAMASDKKDNLPVEARDHIERFHNLFFSLDPDEKVIQENINKALYLADESARRQYENLKEKGYYTNLIAGNISQSINVDSITLQLDDYPYYFKCSAVQKLIRSTSLVTRTLVTEGYLRNVSRSDNNSHGFLIERWTTIENKEIKTTIR